jgi:acetyltransferase-like isoleucine patch superfamily enzyme
MKQSYRLLRYDWPLHFALLVTDWLPDNVPFIRFRGWLSRRFLGSCAAGFEIGRQVSFYNPEKIHIGKNVYIAQGCRIIADDPIYIEDEVMLGPYCVITSANHTRKMGSFRQGEPRPAPVRIGRGSWLAAHVTVTAGTLIGEGVLVAAGAVTVGEIPGNVMVGGIPARVIKEYVDESTPLTNTR